MAEHKMRYLATRQAGEPLPEEEENKATDDESPERAEDQADERPMRDAAMAPTAGYRSKKEKDAQEEWPTSIKRSGCNL